MECVRYLLQSESQVVVTYITYHEKRSIALGRLFWILEGTSHLCVYYFDPQWQNPVRLQF